MEIKISLISNKNIYQFFMCSCVFFREMFFLTGKNFCIRPKKFLLENVSLKIVHPFTHEMRDTHYVIFYFKVVNTIETPKIQRLRNGCRIYHEFITNLI